MRSLSDGLIIEFTEPLANKNGDQEKDYNVSHWRYETTSSYGSPKYDHEALTIIRLYLSHDRKTVSLRLKGLKEGYVIHIQLNENITSTSGQKLWSGEAWYTLNNIPL